MDHLFRKELPPLTAAEQKILLNLSKKNLSTYKEQSVREEFIAPLVQLLGYARDKDYQVLHEEEHKVNDWYVMFGRERYKLDYQFIVWKQGFWLLEVKPARCQDVTSPPPITDGDVHQAFSYAIHPKIDAPYFAVSNGWHTHLYERDREGLSPIFACTQGELPEKFGQLRALVDARQITFGIKRRLLSRIEQVLSADIDLKRGGEFADAVREIAFRVAPKVRENWRRADNVSEQDRKAVWDSQLEASTTDELVETALSVAQTKSDVSDIASVVSRKLVVEPQGFGPTCILLELLTLAKPRPIPCFYFLNSLVTLDMLAEEKKSARQFDLYGVPDRMNFRELTAWCAALLLSHLKGRPELRSLWLLEGILTRIFKRVLLYNDATKKNIAVTVNFQRYVLPEEVSLWMSPGRTIVKAVEALTMESLGRVIMECYNSRERTWNSQRAIEIHRDWTNAEEALLAAMPDYAAVSGALDESWHEIPALEETHHYIDNLGPDVCALLRERPHILRMLPTSSHVDLINLASMGCPPAQECCGELSLPFKPFSRDEALSTAKSFFQL